MNGGKIIVHTDDEPPRQYDTDDLTVTEAGRLVIQRGKTNVLAVYNVGKWVRIERTQRGAAAEVIEK